MSVINRDLNDREADVPKARNIALTVINTEVEVIFSDRVAKFELKLRDAAAVLKIGTASGQSGVTFLTIPAGERYKIDQLSGRQFSLFVQSSTAAQTLEILEWS